MDYGRPLGSERLIDDTTRLIETSNPLGPTAGTSTKINTYIAYDPVSNLQTTKDYLIIRGPKFSTYQQNISLSFGQSQMQFSAPPPSPYIIVDRMVYVGVPMVINFFQLVPPGPAPLLQIGSFDALRAFPVAQITQTLAVTFNNNTVSVNYNDIYPELLRTWYKQDLDYRVYSAETSFQDQYQTYEEGFGASNNPLAGFDSYSPNMCLRGGFPLTILQNTNTVAQVACYITEPIFMSPFYFGDKQVPGFYGLQTFNFTFNMGSDLTRIWSHGTNPNGQHNFSSLNAQIGFSGTPGTGNPQDGNPALYFRYLTPFDDHTPPAINVYDYYDVQRYPTDMTATLAPGASVTISSNNIQFNSIPRRLYLYARRRNQDRTYQTTDTLASITSCVVNWNNVAGQLSSATARDLYRLAEKNGYNASWSDWLGQHISSLGGPLSGFGSMLPLDLGVDICLGPLEAPGLNGTFQFQANLGIRNPSRTQSIQYTFYIVAIFEGTFTIGNNQADRSIGVVSPQEMLNSNTWPVTDYQLTQSLYGGSILGNIKNFITKTALPFAQNTLLPGLRKGLEVGIPIAETLLSGLGGNGYGRGRGRGGWGAQGRSFASGSGLTLSTDESEQEETSNNSQQEEQGQEPQRQRQRPTRSAQGGQILSSSELRRQKRLRYD